MSNTNFGIICLIVGSAFMGMTLIGILLGEGTVQGICIFGAFLGFCATVAGCYVIKKCTRETEASLLSSGISPDDFDGLH